jgi:hypothetical protein
MKSPARAMLRTPSIDMPTVTRDLVVLDRLPELPQVLGRMLGLCGHLGGSP